MSLTEAQLHDDLVREGLHPSRWANDPYFEYGVHDHPYGKVLVVVSGSITFSMNGGQRVVPTIPPPVSRPNGPVTTTHGQHGGGVKTGSWTFGRSFRVEAVTGPPLADPRQVVGMRPGDRLTLPPRTPHSAVVGADGVVCLEAHVPHA